MATHVAVERSTEETSVSEEVVSAVAAATGTDPMDLEPLYETIDPDALDTLFRSDGIGRLRSPDRVTFTYGGCDVVVDWDGSVTATKSTV